jgi:hypothetical protein
MISANGYCFSLYDSGDEHLLCNRMVSASDTVDMIDDSPDDNYSPCSGVLSPTPIMLAASSAAAASIDQPDADQHASSKKSTTRRNAWGNM